MTPDSLSLAEIARVRAAASDAHWQERPYPRPLPPELAPWHVYPPDAGHSILCVLHAHLPSVDWHDVSPQLIPVPVRSVLRGYTVDRGVVVVDLPFSEPCGLEVDESDTEY